jgi:ATP-dependent RNA helicase DDX23/PRP28
VEQKKKKAGWDAKRPAATPLSVEELIRKKKETDAAAAKVCIAHLSMF